MRNRPTSRLFLSSKNRRSGPAYLVESLVVWYRDVVARASLQDECSNFCESGIDIGV